MQKLNEIKVISFDVDGTLVRENFNDLIWRGEVPFLYAQKNKISFEKAKKIVEGEYNRVGEENPRWYDIKFWVDYFKLNVSYKDIISKHESKIEVYPDVTPTLEKLKRKYQLIIITMMPSEFLAPKLKKIGNHFDYAFSTISEFNDLKTSRGYMRICERLRVSPSRLLHIGDQWEFDYIAPRRINMDAILIDRKNIRKGKWVIRDLREIERML